MSLCKLRYFLTNHVEKVFFTYENDKLLIHPSVNKYTDLLNKLEDDIELIPLIEKTDDNIEIKFYRYGYNEDVFNKSELLAFIFASIDEEWDIVKGIDLNTLKSHFWLKCGSIIYDASLAIITSEEVYNKRFKELTIIKNEDIVNYLKTNNNLYKFYSSRFLNRIRLKNDLDFSIKFINKIKSEFDKNVLKEYSLDEEKIKYIKKYFMIDNFINLRQVLSKKRKSYLRKNVIALHPSVDESILKIIEKDGECIKDLMKKEYDLNVDYFNHTLGNCYALSILLNLFDERFKLIQGGIPFENSISNKEYYQHSWLEIDDIVYDPALRVITPKDLYYTFVHKQDEYSKEDTEKMLKRIGFNLTHFRDFIKGKQIGKDETISYRLKVKEIDSPKMEEEANLLIKTLKKK